MLTGRFTTTIARSLVAATCVVTVATGCNVASFNKAAAPKHLAPISTITSVDLHGTWDGAHPPAISDGGVVDGGIVDGASSDGYVSTP